VAVVVVDDREVRSGVVLELEERGATVDVRRLEVGDYVCSGRVAVERKTVNDFHSSVFDNPRHLFEGLSDLKKNYERPILLIEGDPLDLYTARAVHPNSIRGILCSVAVDMGVSITYTQGVGDTAGFLLNTAVREQEDHVRSMAWHGKRSHRSLDDQLVYVVAALPNMGTKTAVSLLSRFRSLEALFSAGVDELVLVPGVGVKTAEQIREVGSRDYVVVKEE